MKTTKKLIAVICTLAILAGALSTVGYAAYDVDYTITNPYADVDWSWDQYKTDLHTHTTASDGALSPLSVVEFYQLQIRF